jgi:hypothetical protein
MYHLVNPYMTVKNTEALYREQLGKLFYIGTAATNKTTNKTEWLDIVVMPYQLTKRGGWWFYSLDYLTGPNHEVWNRPFASKEFLRRARPLQSAANTET